MFKENMKNQGGSKETKEDNIEKETKERLLKLFAVMEEMYDGFREAIGKPENKDWFFKTDKIFTADRVKKLYDEVEEISKLAIECGRKDIHDMLASLRIDLFTVNDLYEENLMDGQEKNKKYNDLMDIMRAMQVLIGAQRFFTIEKEAEK